MEKEVGMIELEKTILIIWMVSSQMEQSKLTKVFGNLKEMQELLDPKGNILKKDLG